MLKTALTQLGININDWDTLEPGIVCVLTVSHNDTRKLSGLLTDLGLVRGEPNRDVPSYARWVSAHLVWFPEYVLAAFDTEENQE